MKRALSLLIVLLMAFQGFAALAEAADAVPAATEEIVEAAEAPEPQIAYDYDELTVGTVTPFNGCFFTDMWGNVTSDLDIRLLLHGFNLVEWRGGEGIFNIDPSVVSGIVVTENGLGDRTYTLTLYDDLYYSDGTRITARDYAFSMLLSIAPEMAEIGAGVRAKDYLIGYEDYISGAASSLAGVRIINDGTLAITVSGEYLPYFYEFALLDCTPYPIGVIAPGCRVADDGNGVYIANEDPEVQEPVFTADLLRQTILDPETGYLSHPSVVSGPYRLTAYDGRQVELEINEYYKGNSMGAKPLIPRLVCKVVQNETMIDAFAQGDYGLLNKCLSAEVLQEGTRLITSGDRFEMTNYPRNGMSFISFCCERESVNSVAVRQAIAMCLDKDGLVNDTVANYGLRVDGYYGMGQWMYQLVDGTHAFPMEAPAADADEAAIAEYEAKIAEWEALTLDNIRVYAFDVAGAVALLEGEGWTLNREGGAFDPEKDDVRCKDVDGEIKALELKLIAPEGSSLNDNLQANFIDHLAEAGIVVDVEIMPMEQLLKYYYRREARDCDMVMLATNFDVVFDPAMIFMPDGAQVNTYNPTAIDDEQLYALAMDMRRTDSGDTLAYCRKWVAFQERFQEIEPVIPIYSNVYFDFYPRVLHDYDVSSNITWTQAIVGAYLSDAADVEEEEGAEEEGIQVDAGSWITD